MKNYEVEIVETTVRVYKTIIEAIDAENAQTLARESYENGEFENGFEVSDSVGGVEFNVAER